MRPQTAWLGQVPVALARPVLGQDLSADPSTWRVFQLQAWIDKVTTQLEVRPDCVFESPEWNAFWKGLRAKAQFNSIQLARLHLGEIAYIELINECLSLEPGEWRGRYITAIDDYLDEFQEAYQRGQTGEEPETTGADTTDEPADNTLLTVGGIGAVTLLVAALA